MSGTKRGASLALACLAIVFSFSACGPQKKLEWSADGSRAALISKGRLYICNQAGQLKGPLADSVGRATWFPDSLRIAVAETRELDKWEELVKIAPAEFDEKKIISAARDLREELITYDGDLDNFKPSNSRRLSMQQWMAAALYLSLQDDQRLRKKFGDKWKDFDQIKVAVSTVLLISATDDPANKRVPLFSTLNDIVDLRVSPDGGAVACVTSRSEGWAESEVKSLEVSTLGEPRGRILAADDVTAGPDWSGDSRSLFFFRRAAPDSDSGGTAVLCRLAVRDEKGALLGKLPESSNLALALFSASLRVRCLDDGRLLFAAAEVSLPAGFKASPRGLTLFALTPGETSVIKRVIPASADARLPDRADLFELSPDQKLVAVPGEKGRISVVTLATGEVNEVIDKDDSDGLRTVPVWRNSGQLSWVSPANSALTNSARDEVILWSAGGKAVTISGKWPNDVIDGIK